MNTASNFATATSFSACCPGRIFFAPAPPSRKKRKSTWLSSIGSRGGGVGQRLSPADDRGARERSAEASRAQVPGAAQRAAGAGARLGQKHGVAPFGEPGGEFKQWFQPSSITFQQGDWHFLAVMFGRGLWTWFLCRLDAPGAKPLGKRDLAIMLVSLLGVATGSTPLLLMEPLFQHPCLALIVEGMLCACPCRSDIASAEKNDPLAQASRQKRRRSPPCSSPAVVEVCFQGC